MHAYTAVASRVIVMSIATASLAAAQGSAVEPGGAQASASVADNTLAAAFVEPLKDEARAAKRQAQRDPLARSGLALPEPQLTFETTKGSGRATGTVGFVQKQSAGETSVLFALSAPIGAAADAEAHPLDLRGLANGSTLTVGFSSARLFRTFSVADIVALCKGIPKEDCTAGKLQDAHPDVSKRLLDTVFQGIPFIYGAAFTYGHNKFAFFDASGARQDPVERNDLEVDANLGFLVNKRTNLLAFSAAYAHGYSASPDKTQLCRPLSNPAVTRCDAAVIGQPNEERSAIGTIEYRWQLPGEHKVPIAIAPKFQFSVGFDDAEDERSFEVPVYFFQEKADPKATSTAPKLNGGVGAGWRSADGFQAYVFIGTTFKLFER